MTRNEQIVARRDAGALPHEIASEMGLTRGTVIGVLNRAGRCVPGFRVYVAPRSPLFGERVASAKLTEAAVRALREARWRDVPNMADALGVAVCTAMNARYRVTWAHVK